jgi:putative copper export protein
LVEIDEFTVRTTLHILAVCVWVGGQITLAGLLPAIRKLDDEQAAKKLARQFNRVAWPAFALAVITGIWNVAEVDLGSRSTSYQVLLMFKLLIVALSGVSAFAHTQTANRALLAIFGALTGLTAILAVGVGVLLLTST